MNKAMNFAGRVQQGEHTMKTLLPIDSSGQYSGSPPDHREPYLKTVLNFLGIEDVFNVRAEGLARGGVDHERAIRSVKDSIQRLAAA